MHGDDQAQGAGRELPAPGGELPPGADRQPQGDREARARLRLQSRRHRAVRLRKLHAGAAASTLARNPEYFRGPATLEKIDFRIIKDDKTAAIALQNGEVDIAMRLGHERAACSASRPTAAYRDEQTLRLRVGVSIFNLSNQYLKDVRVRQAFAHAVDRATIAEDDRRRSPAASGTTCCRTGWSTSTPPTCRSTPTTSRRRSTLMSAAGCRARHHARSSRRVRVTEQSSSCMQSYLIKIGIKIRVRRRGHADLQQHAHPRRVRHRRRARCRR